MAAQHRERLAAFCSGLQDRDLQSAMRFCADQGIAAIELGVGGWPSTIHADAEVLVGDKQAVTRLKTLASTENIRIAALACHGNPLHPDTAFAKRHHTQFLAALEAANALCVPVLVGFSGQPGHQLPNWPVVAWPEDYADEWERQWIDLLIPYWQPLAFRAEELGVKIALEMHGGFAVHSPSTLLRLRQACGPAIAANLDPSHLWWQGIDPIDAVAILGEAVAHFHVKDLIINPTKLALHGWLDHTPHANRAERAWHFGTPGKGHDAGTWRNLLNALLDSGYDGVFSIEHEGCEPPAVGIADAATFIGRL